MFTQILNSARSFIKPQLITKPTNEPQTPIPTTMGNTRNEKADDPDGEEEVNEMNPINVNSPDLNSERSSPDMFSESFTDGEEGGNAPTDSPLDPDVKEVLIEVDPINVYSPDLSSKRKLQNISSDIKSLEDGEDGGDFLTDSPLGLDGKEELIGVNPINVYSPDLSSKRKSQNISSDMKSLVDGEDGGDDPTDSPHSKKRKILPMEAKDEDEKITKTRVVVEIPVRRMTPQAESPLAIELQRPTNIKKKFGSEEPPEIFSTAEEEQGSVTVNIADEPLEAVEDSDESSDNDAPEEVGAADAAKSAKSNVKRAAEAINGLRKKRKERFTKFNNIPDKVVLTSEREDDKDEDLQVKDAAPEFSSNTVSRKLLPDILPEEFLDDDSDDEVDLLPIVSTHPPLVKKSRKTTFDLAVEKMPKDRHVGSTTYRVTKTSSKNLAPKSDHAARQLKESWLQGRSGNKIGANRRPMKQGFFKK